MIRDPRAGVIGWPVSHSRSPLIHNHWLKTHALAGSYGLLPIAPDDIEGYLRDFSNSGLCGANVTAPYKPHAFAACDTLSEQAHALGAVNTLWLEGDKLHGTNTDVYGFLAGLDAQTPGWDTWGGPCVVLGAGGAARAVIFALASRGLSPVRIINRTRSHAEELVADLADYLDKVEICDWPEAAQACEGARFLVNTTSLGLAGGSDLALDLTTLCADAVVNDIVYMPLRTGLLRRAEALGLRTADGLGMLLHQAVPGFETWFGVRPQVDTTLRQLIVNDLAAGRPATDGSYSR